MLDSFPNEEDKKVFIDGLKSNLDGLYELCSGKKIPELLDKYVEYVELLNRLNSEE